jgi:hypothetical protein
MSETFTKLFSSLTDSTIWAEDNDTRILWITMLAMADKTGYIGASIPGLAARARISIEATERALAKFMAPDPYSRSKDNDGRRIEEADRGWILLNYQRYRDMRDEEARREYERVRKREQRQREKSQNVPDSPAGSPDVVDSPEVSAQAEAEAEAEAETDQNIGASRLRSGTAYPAAFEEVWEATGRRGNKFKGWKAWKAASSPPWAALSAPWAAYMRSADPVRGYVQHLSTWLNAKGWAQEWPEAPAQGGRPVAKTRSEELFEANRKWLEVKS